MNGLEKFATSFLFLNLHAVIILIWKKILSLTLFKIITVSRSSTLLRVFLMGRSGCPTKRGNLGGLSGSQKVWTFSFCWVSPPPKKLSHPVPRSHSIYWKERVSLTAFREILSKVLPEAFFSATIWLTWKTSLELNPLTLSSVQQDYLPELYPIIPLNIYGKPWG